MENINNYPNLRINGRIFPLWVLHNFKNYKLPEIIRQDNTDPCSVKTKLELRKYQEFIAAYLDYKSPYHDILLYHGLGSGKTGTMINVYNALYNATSGWNVFLLIKASLHDNPWEKELQRWLSKQDYDHRYSNIIWIHYDSPFADTEFMDSIKKTDSSLKNMYIIDEAHNFISNVYSNLTQKKGKRAINIYDYILQDKRENQSTRVILLSGTPSINRPFELALLFNLLRPDTFPKSEVLFEQYYVENSVMPTINPKTKNLFQRRIMGLVSYYIGATPDLYASQTINFVDVKMSKYQTEIYEYFEEIENLMAKKNRELSRSNETYRSYTRQASNFVFPPIDEIVTGEGRPRPSKFKIGEREMELLLKTKDTEKIKSTLSSQSQAYFKMLTKFSETFDNLLQEIHTKELDAKHNITHDIQKFSAYELFDDYNEKETTKSELLKLMIQCSGKYVNIIFNLTKSTGPVLIYSNYVLVEGLDMLKIYLKYFGYSNYKEAPEYYGYAEFHNGISRPERKETIKTEIDPINKNGKLVKIVMFSPAGAEGISLANIRQVHIMEPYWHEVRVTQMIGRAIRACSHADLPLKERHVNVYRYKSIKHNIKIKETTQNQIVTTTKIKIEDPITLKTVDFDIEKLARSKNNLIQTFLDAIKEVAIDCELFKNHNMMSTKYRCFQFNEVSLFDKNIGPAYKEDILEDMKIENGLNSTKTIVIKVKALKINGIINDDKTNIKPYWYNPDSSVVYDYDLHYPIGKIKQDLDNMPLKVDKDTYHIELIHIPLIKAI
ncbi:MAG: DEAD/SNF2-like helicase [Gaeavirus sp.]|uniref:DEAD/SNF2-like helicase n=1 Tax=Gaeavirus sp. TaxID=2487767 RepID=A0A3G4ZZN2_9VIRU|nr:MAG: DEAD/SNF2-like helicase [Gaeavirus sp.]